MVEESDIPLLRIELTASRRKLAMVTADAESRKVEQLLAEMEAQGPAPPLATYNALLSACARAGALRGWSWGTPDPNTPRLRLRKSLAGGQLGHFKG